MIRRRNKKRKTKHNTKQIHPNSFFLLLVSLGLAWNAKEYLVTGTAIHDRELNRLFCYLPECQSATWITTNIYSISALWFDLAKGWVSWSKQTGRRAASFYKHLIGINWWGRQTFGSENSSTSNHSPAPQESTSITALVLVKTSQ